MTLTELLVVVVVLLLLLVAVAPNLRPTDDQKGREAAATLTGMVSRVKSRAAANTVRGGAGIWLQPLESRASVAVSAGARIHTPPSRGVIDLFTCMPQDPYIGDDPASAIVHVNRNNRLTPPALPPIDPALLSTDAVLTFSSLYCPLIREFCGDTSRIRIPRNSGANVYAFRLLSPSEQASLETTHPGFFPRPYRPCNYGISPGDRDYEDPSRNPSPLGVQQNDYYDESDSDRINFSRSTLVLGIIRRLNADLPTEPDKFDPGHRAVEDPDPEPPDNSVADQSPRNYPGLDAGQSFSIDRPNMRAPTPPLSLPAGYVVDVAWSMINGTQLLNNSEAILLGTVSTSPGITITAIDDFLSNEPIQLMFDVNGNLGSVVYRIMLRGFGPPGTATGSVVEQPATLTGDVYLLVGRADRAGQPFHPNAPSTADDSIGANWQYPDSRWVKISRSGGITLIADPKYGARNVYDSQYYARQGISAVRN